jgi:hypothetical protein
MVGRVVNTLVFQLMEKDQLVGFIRNALEKKSSWSYLPSASTEPLQTG